MRNFFLTTAAILLASSCFYSCSDSDNGTGGGVDIDKVLEYPYSKLTPEEQKKKLVNDGREISTQITGIADESSTKALYSLTEISESLISLLDNDADELTPVKALKTEDLIVKLSKYTGAYTWDSAKEEWKKDADADNLVLVFPAYKGDTKTQGKLELVAKSSGVVIDNHEVPSKIDAVIYVANKKEGSIQVVATGINEVKIVETADMNISLGDYLLASDINKKGSKNKANLEFSKNSTALIKGYIDLAGEITAEVLEDEDFSNFDNGNLSLALSDKLALVGFVDIKSLFSAEERIGKQIDAIYVAYKNEGDVLWNEYKEGKITGDEYVTKREELFKSHMDKAKVYKLEEIELYNKYTNIALASTSEKYKVASVFFEFDNEGWDDYGWFYDDCRIIYLKFNDETRITPDVFFGEGFTSVVNIWNDFLEKFN